MAYLHSYLTERTPHNLPYLDDIPACMSCQSSFGISMPTTCSNINMIYDEILNSWPDQPICRRTAIVDPNMDCAELPPHVCLRCPARVFYPFRYRKISYHLQWSLQRRLQNRSHPMNSSQYEVCVMSHQYQSINWSIYYARQLQYYRDHCGSGWGNHAWNARLGCR